MSEPTRLVVGPFTWQRAADRSAEEAWDLQLPWGVGPRWTIKNYGGPPGPGFAGWKLVSGGPFDDAGVYESRDAAMKGVVPFLVKYYENEVARHVLETKKLMGMVAGWQAQIQKEEGA